MFHFGVFKMGWNILIFLPHNILFQLVELTHILSIPVLGTLKDVSLPWHAAFS